MELTLVGFTYVGVLGELVIAPLTLVVDNFLSAVDSDDAIGFLFTSMVVEEDKLDVVTPPIDFFSSTFLMPSFFTSILLLLLMSSKYGPLKVVTDLALEANSKIVDMTGFKSLPACKSLNFQLTVIPRFLHSFWKNSMLALSLTREPLGFMFTRSELFPTILHISLKSQS